MPDVALAWGAESLTVPLPDDWRVVQVAEASLRRAPPDWADRLGRDLSQPGAGPPLGQMLKARRGGRIELVVEDNTRHSPLPKILEAVMREIHHARIPDEQVEIFLAGGMHVPMTPEQVREKIGPLADAVAWRCNPWDSPGQYVRVGQCDGVDIEIDRRVATADLRILVTAVSPHLQAGFGGGHKMLLPGCASLETIRALHRRGLERGFSQWVGLDADRNRMRAFIDKAGTLVDAFGGASFGVQYVLDGNDRPTHVATGEVLPAQRMLAKQCAVACGVLVPQAADVLIVNAAPRDLDLWQCFKCIPNTLWAARPGGVILCMARCPAAAQGMKLPRFAPRATWVRRIVRLLGAEGLYSLLTRACPSLAGDAAFFVRLALGALHRNPILMVSPALHAAGVRLAGLEIFASPDEGIARTRAILGVGPQKVVVFPSGGTTYPVAPPQERNKGTA